MLDQLPLDIFQMVISEIKHTRDIASLSEVSKGLHRILMPVLYEKVIVSEQEDRLDKLLISSPWPMKTYFKEDGSRDTFDILSFVKDLRFISPIHECRSNRCYNYCLSFEDDETLDSVDVWHDDFMKSLSDAFRSAFLHLPKNSLRSFAWQLGCCIPDEIAGYSGYIQANQTSIQSLWLTTDGTCPNFETSIGGLLQLKTLRTLSWKGLHPEENQSTLNRLVKKNSVSLEFLELETMGHGFDPLRLNNIMCDIRTGDTFHFVSLQHLSLCNISLFSACKTIMSAVCMEKLRSLKLIHCRHTFRFLRKLAKSTHAFRLNSFEVVFDEYSSISDWYDGNTNPIGEFLMTFEGLEELYISTQNSNSTIGAMLDPILHHRFSLTRLVHHDRGVNIDEESDRFELFRDFSLPWEEVVDHVLDLMALECVGLTMPPSELRQKLESNATRQKLKLLHLRVTGRDYETRDLTAELSFPDTSTRSRPARTPSPDAQTPASDDFMSMEDLVDFAEWAFGPTGFPTLLVLAYGDFSHQGRFRWTNLLFCRAAIPAEETQRPSFRIMSQKDEYLWDLIDGGRQMLGVCPTEQTVDFMNSTDGDDGDYAYESSEESSDDGNV
ncbi:hypothetical protein Egran_05840 [Elaphomyces granulatus]|uniref:F-box domain-containing protein n=1 Tax=Elaphomyces granulatus TaxID=519963 RepID=A0A232LQJ5_9EURO|nr:hypothetical protein Egran_05840 [Elaphomyces granulatus]